MSVLLWGFNVCLAVEKMVGGKTRRQRRQVDELCGSILEVWCVHYVVGCQWLAGPAYLPLFLLLLWRDMIVTSHHVWLSLADSWCTHFRGLVLASSLFICLLDPVMIIVHVEFRDLCVLHTPVSPRFLCLMMNACAQTVVTMLSMHTVDPNVLSKEELQNVL